MFVGCAKYPAVMPSYIDHQIIGLHRRLRELWAAGSSPIRPLSEEMWESFRIPVVRPGLFAATTLPGILEEIGLRLQALERR